METIFRPVLWLETSGGVREYRADDAKRIYKWVLFRHQGNLHLAATPRLDSIGLHRDLITAIALEKGWCSPHDVASARDRERDDGLTARAFMSMLGVEVLGGGTKTDKGEIKKSVDFGWIPAVYADDVKELLGY